MAYAVLSKEMANTNPMDAFVGRVIVDTTKLRMFEKDFVVVPWNEWLQMKKETEV